MNEKALGKVLMPSNIAYTTDIKTALKKCEIVVIAVATK